MVFLVRVTLGLFWITWVTRVLTFNLHSPAMAQHTKAKQKIFCLRYVKLRVVCQYRRLKGLFVNIAGKRFVAFVVAHALFA